MKPAPALQVRPELRDARVQRRGLEAAILAAVGDFEASTGLTVTAVDLTHHMTSDAAEGPVWVTTAVSARTEMR